MDLYTGVTADMDSPVHIADMDPRGSKFPSKYEPPLNKYGPRFGPPLQNPKHEI